jgi:hypothetical protein
MKTLVALPYLGELGWLCFSWSPLVHRKFIDGNYDRCIVYCNGGVESLFPFAEVRTFNPPHKPHQAECNTVFEYRTSNDWFCQWTDEFRTHHVGCDFLSGFDGRHGDILFNPRLPTSLHAPSLAADDGRTSIALCVRDRSLGEHRNYPIEKWLELEELLSYDFNTIVVGKVRPEWVDKPWVGQNFLNKTDISQLIGILSAVDLAMGPSTGTLHLASRCKTDHLVWGVPRNVPRYNKTNWWGIQCKVLDTGFDTEVCSVITHLEHWWETGEFK